MKYLLLLLSLSLVFAIPVAGQQEATGSVTLVVIDKASKAPLVRAAYKAASATGEVTDGKGVIAGLQPGRLKITVSSAGFEDAEVEVTVVAGSRVEVVAELEPGDEELAQVTVSTTRTGREIEDEPTRLEAIDEEEVDEKTNMRAANVSMILNESTGIKVQQTSATAYTQSIRIQGLDGRYTQLLKDGFPAFGGFSGSLSILDIPPLDLKQVEIIKGASSTFYGGGAIAGVINFISKEPSDKPSTLLLLNISSALGFDASIFRTAKKGRFAYTFLGSFNPQREYDADGDSFTDLPRTRVFSLAPRFFFDVSQKTRFTFGNSATFQRRKGGDIFVVRGRPDAAHRYFESNDSERNITTFGLTHELESGASVSVKQSVGVFRRRLLTPGYEFGGSQLNSFTEASFAKAFGRHAVVAGATLSVDRFTEKATSATLSRRNERRASGGAFVQDTFEVNDRIAVEAGLRVDGAEGFGAFALPRVSVLLRGRGGLSSRLGFGLGYKSPSMFTEDAETLLFRNVLPVGMSLKSERSRGGTFDVNYKKEFGETGSFSINQMFFLTEIVDALILRQRSGGIYGFENAAGDVTTRGFETNLRARYRMLNAFLGYTLTDAKADYLSGDKVLPLTPKSRFNSAAVIEREDDFKVGLEAYFTGRQALSDRSRTPSYWVVGLSGQKTFGRITFFINAENITDTRQTKFGPVVFPPFASPSFAEIYTHVEGRIFNGGLKFRL